jgi:glutamine synthetase
VGDIAREIVDEHLDLCLEAGINHEGINAEVAKGQWEFQIFGKGSAKAADDVWVARYLLLRLCEKYQVDVQWHCKPFRTWTGTDRVCTATSPPSSCAKLAARTTSSR